jgi:phage terminase large subunit
VLFLPMPAPLNGLVRESLERWIKRPDLFVREVFNVTPDPWQDEALRAFPTCPRLAFKASKGPGKTALLAWLGWNFMLTRPYVNGAAVSISADNLRDNLWKELAVWRQRAPILQHTFEWQKERIFARDHTETWFLSARSWPKAADATQLGNTLAGLHGEYVIVLADETGGMPREILESAEGIFSGTKEAHIIQAGNTNTLDGALYNACVRNRHMWKVVVISGDPDDPNRSPRVPVEWARDLIRTYGRDNPFVKVSVLGEWPTASVNALLGPDEVEAAMKRQYQTWDIENAPRVLGVDVAREGNDASVIFPRQGLVAFKPHIMRNVTSTQGAGQVARVWTDWNVDAVFIDNTGGFGAGWIDQLRLLNRQAIGIGFAERRDKRYYNMRAEMYFKMAEWVKAGGALPDVPDLIPQLTQTLYSFKGDALIIEPKEEIKVKLGKSPDEADSLALTFAEPVASKTIAPIIAAIKEPPFDPFQEYR